MKRWALFVGLAACAAVAAGCGKEAIAPDSTWAAVSAECREALQTYKGLGDKAVMTDVVGDCERFEYRSVAEPQEWRQVREEVYALNPDGIWSRPAIIDTEKVVKEPPNGKPIAEFREYGAWHDLPVGDLDPQGRIFLGPETIGMRYLPLYRWGCEAPSDPEVTFSCELTLSITTRLEQWKETSYQLGVNFGVGDTTNGLGAGIEGGLEHTERRVLSIWEEDGYPATVIHDLNRSSEDYRWHVAELRHFRTYLIRDVYHCEEYGALGFGFARHKVYCQLSGYQHQRIDALELHNIGTYTLAEWRQCIEDEFPGVDITPEAQALLIELEQGLLHGEPNVAPMPKKISCETNVNASFTQLALKSQRRRRTR